MFTHKESKEKASGKIEGGVVWPQGAPGKRFLIGFWLSPHTTALQLQKLQMPGEMQKTEKGHVLAFPVPQNGRGTAGPARELLRALQLAVHQNLRDTFFSGEETEVASNTDVLIELALAEVQLPQKWRVEELLVSDTPPQYIRDALKPVPIKRKERARTWGWWVCSAKNEGYKEVPMGICFSAATPLETVEEVDRRLAGPKGLKLTPMGRILAFWAPPQEAGLYMGMLLTAVESITHNKKVIVHAHAGDDSVGAVQKVLMLAEGESTASLDAIRRAYRERIEERAYAGVLA